MSERVDRSVAEIYPDYMFMIRSFVSEGILEIEDPSSVYANWAKAASLGNLALADQLGKLAQLTETAYKQRYLEGMPMLIDPSIDSVGEKDFSPIERFHFIRLFAKDVQYMGESCLTDPGSAEQSIEVI
jgi:hypothetical protein